MRALFTVLAQARIAEDAGAVATALEQLAFSPVLPPVRKEPSIRTIARVYARDGYICRYCGQKVVLTAVLRLLHRLYPDVIPFQSNWRAGLTHPAFEALSATLDHLDPVAGGGDHLEPSNLVCACWTCNRRKSDLTVAQLGWAVRPIPEDQEWDGLVGLYAPLWAAAGRPALSDYEREWMRAVDVG